MAKKGKDIPMPMQLGSVKKQPVGVRVVCGILKYLFLALIVVISIGPIIWAGLSSFKTYAEINTSAIALPKSFNFKNYADAFKYAPIQEYFFKQYHYRISQRSCYSLLRSNVCIRCSKI